MVLYKKYAEHYGSQIPVKYFIAIVYQVLKHLKLKKSFNFKNV